MDIKNFSLDFLNLLSQSAKQSSRQRHHTNIHQHYNEPCQRLFNAIEVASYIRPHRHLIDPKDECLIAVRGLMSLVVFDDIGQVQKIIRFGAQITESQEAIGVGVNIPAGVWHTVIADLPDSILFEVKSGPFNPEQAKEYATWAPAENTPEAAEYLIKLKRTVSAIIHNEIYKP